jgi:hypothetical protein
LPILKQVAFTAFCILLIFQTSGQMGRFVSEYKSVAAKPIKERYPPLLKDPYAYALFCQEHLSGKHSADFISDMDVSRDPGMYVHRALVYFLYPIDIRNIRRKPADSLIIFEKNNPIQSVPDGFKIVGFFNGRNVFAIKQEINHGALLAN